MQGLMERVVETASPVVGLIACGTIVAIGGALVAIPLFGVARFLFP